MMLRKCLTFFAFLIFFGYAMVHSVAACPACWAGYGKGDERFNKPLADCRKVYEREGRDAIPYLRDVLKTSTDPAVINRAAGYIVELDDTGSVPLLEDIVLNLVKRVSFGNFGFDTYEFRARLAAAHALVKLGPSQELADQIWERYDRLSFEKKIEVPYILNGLQDSRLEERLVEILEREEDHQLMVGALDVMAIGGSGEAIPALEKKIEEWKVAGSGGSESNDPEAPVIYYAPLRIKAAQTIRAIRDREEKTELTQLKR